MYKLCDKCVYSVHNCRYLCINCDKCMYSVYNYRYLCTNYVISVCILCIIVGIYV